MCSLSHFNSISDMYMRIYTGMPENTFACTHCLYLIFQQIKEVCLVSRKAPHIKTFYTALASVVEFNYQISMHVTHLVV